MDWLQDEIFSKKNIIYILVLGITILAIPLGVQFVQNQQATQLQSQAAGDEITFPGLREDATTGNPVTSDPNVRVQLKSPFGPPPQTP